MPPSSSSTRRLHGLSFPLFISALYAIVGCLYIALSDRILEAWIEDVATLTQIQTWKGWGFIILTAVVLLLLLLSHERRRIEAGRALRESEQRYRQIVETTNEGVWIVDADGITIYVNDTLTHMFGATRERMLGRHRQDFIDEAWRGLARRQFHKRRQGVRDQYECRFIRADGSPLWAIVASSPLTDETGAFRGAVKMLTDITQRKADEHALKASFESQKHLLNELDHRVRNNLASLRSLLDLTKSASRDVDTLATSLGGRLDAMSRAHALLSSAKWTPPDLQSLLHALIPGKVRQRVKLSGPSVPVPPPQVGAMAIVLHELIANAALHGALKSPGGVGSVRVEWTVEPDDDANDRGGPGGGGTPGGTAVSAVRSVQTGVQTGETPVPPTPVPPTPGAVLTIRWIERGGPPIEGQPAAGPGTGLILGLVRSDLQGAAELTYPRSGAAHTLRLRLEASHGPQAVAGVMPMPSAEA